MIFDSNGVCTWVGKKIAPFDPNRWVKRAKTVYLPICAPEATRTPNLLLRKQALCPIELRGLEPKRL